VPEVNPDAPIFEISSQTEEAEYLGWVVAVYDYEAQNEQELTLVTGLTFPLFLFSKMNNLTNK
jgi:hypothetical protein